MKDGLTLLYVEDDAIIRENFTHIFKSYFTNVITTDNGDEALKLYAENNIDVAILDVQINGLDGISVASEIREVDSDIIILMISAYSDTDKLLKAINLKLFGYLLKPVVFHELEKVLKEIITSCSSENSLLLNEEYTWEHSSETLLVKHEKVKLTKNEIEVIKILLKNKNQYLSACDIGAQMINESFTTQGNCNNVVQLLSRLKKKIQVLNEDNYFIENYYGIGYRISLE